MTFHHLFHDFCISKLGQNWHAKSKAIATNQTQLGGVKKFQVRPQIF